MSEIENEELENVSGGETYLNGVCKVCGKTFPDSNGLKHKYFGNSCQAKTVKYYCDECGGEIKFSRITGDGS